MEATQLNFRINGGDELPFSCTKNDGYEIQPLGNLSLSKGTYEIELTRAAITATWSYVNLLSIFLTPNASTKIEQADELKEISVYTAFSTKEFKTEEGENKMWFSPSSVFSYSTI